MKLCTQTHRLAETFGPEECIRMLKRVGYDAIDWSFFEMTKGEGPWLRDGWEEYAHKLRALADAEGIEILQAHAPYPSSRREDASTPGIKKDSNGICLVENQRFGESIKKRIIRSMEVASILGVKHIVVHPKQHLPYRGHEEELFEMNMEFYRSLIPECERLNLKICVENMWQRDEKRGYLVDSTCSHIEEFCRYIDTLYSPWITGCLDLGHCALVGTEPQDFIRGLGHDRIGALHVHDVNYIRDCHTMPYMESLNWAEITKALADIDYQGLFTFEADNFLLPLPDEVKEDGARLMVSVGRHLISMIEKH